MRNIHDSSRPPAGRLRSQRGFTILEAAFAAGVMAFAISTSIIVLGRGFNSLDSARCISYASQIMQSELEKMRLTSWGDGTTAGTGHTGITAYPMTATTLTLAGSGFVNAADLGSRMTVTRTASDVHTGMIKITYTITWTTFDKKTLSRTYVTYYGQKGLYDFFAV